MRSTVAVSAVAQPRRSATCCKVSSGVIFWKCVSKASVSAFGLVGGVSSGGKAHCRDCERSVMGVSFGPQGPYSWLKLVNHGIPGSHLARPS